VAVARKCLHEPRRILSALVLLLLLLLVGVAPLAAETLRIGIYGQEPPLSFIDTQGEPRGFDVDVARALCARLHTQCELRPTPWQELIPRVQSGTLDAAVASQSITPARRARVAFTRPYYESPARLVARTGRFPDSAPATLSGRRIGVRRGTTLDDYLEQTYGDQVRLVRYPTMDDALIDLLLGRLDLVLGEQLLLDQRLLRQPLGRDYAFVGEPLSSLQTLGEGQGITVHPAAADLRARLDAAVAALLQDGVIEQLGRRWFGDGWPDQSPVHAEPVRLTAPPPHTPPTTTRRR
jgi:arginine/ornithine transport system substrate-binding protein